MNDTLHPFHILREVFDLLPDTVFVVNEMGHIVMHNAHAPVTFGYDKEELVGKRIDILVPTRLREKHGSKMREFFVKKESRNMAEGIRLVAVKKDNSEFRVDIALSPFNLYGASYTIAVVRELSDKIFLEQKVQMLEKMKEELERFAYVVSHDLKSPVKRIHMLVDLIVMELGDKVDSNLQTLINYLHQSVSITENLIHGILEQARLESETETSDIDLNILLEEAKKGVIIPDSFTFEIPTPLPVIRGNYTQWLQVLLNMVTNSIKYNDKEKGILRIETSEQGNFYRFSFKDNGTVVPPEKREIIFTLFKRGHDNEDKGSHGIGLSIVKKIVEKAGGSIEYSVSDLGGSEFNIFWPIHPSKDT